MGRFSALAVLACLICVSLVSCEDTREATLRYRLIATVEIDGQKVEGSTVMEMHYKNIRSDPHFLDYFIQLTTHINPRVTLTEHAAEALILDLKGRGTVFILPSVRTDEFAAFHEVCLLLTLGIENKLHGLTREDMRQISNAKGRMPLQLLRPEERRPDYPKGFVSKYPAMVTFRNEKDPRTIEDVDPENMERRFPGVRLLNVEIEVTDAPLTRVLTKRLPWLMTVEKNETLEREPVGSMRSPREKPVVRLIRQIDFFGRGWERMLQVK
jgi:hypothetical protein